MDSCKQQINKQYLVNKKSWMTMLEANGKSGVPYSLVLTERRRGAYPDPERLQLNVVSWNKSSSPLVYIRKWYDKFK